MSILIENALILAMDEEHGADPFRSNIQINGDTIVAVADAIDAPPDAHRISGHDHLVIPGLVNAHIHTEQNPFRGRYPSLPLEILMLYAYPMVGAHRVPPDLVYLRTMLVAMESLKTGVTCILDDVIEVPGQDFDQLQAVFRAYDDAGMRANCSGHMINKHFLDTIPYIKDVLPSELRAEFENVEPPSTEYYLEFAREAITRFHEPDGRLRYVIAPSAPQRCTEDLLAAAAELSVAEDVAYHVHVLETHTQAVTGPVMYGKTLIQLMSDLGALNEGTSIAHAIWVGDDDIELMAEAGCSIAHNPICNLRIGAGVAPLRRFLDAGVNVALGTDGISSNDTSRIFDVMHVAGLVHNVTSIDYHSWPAAEEILMAATIGGARSMRLGGTTGAIEVGRKADLVMLNLKTLNFTPLNDVRRHLVYCENGTSVETVIVNGDVVVEAGRLTRVDEEAVIDEARERLPEFLAQHAQVEELNRTFEPYFAEVHRMCSEMDVGMERRATF